MENENRKKGRPKNGPEMTIVGRDNYIDSRKYDRFVQFNSLALEEIGQRRKFNSVELLIDDRTSCIYVKRGGSLNLLKGSKQQNNKKARLSINTWDKVQSILNFTTSGDPKFNAKKSVSFGEIEREQDEFGDMWYIFQFKPKQPLEI